MPAESIWVPRDDTNLQRSRRAVASKGLLLAVAAAVILVLSGCAVHPAAAPSPAQSTVVVPNEVGETGDVANSALSAIGLSVRWSGGTVILAKNWTVTAQDPAAGSSLNSGGTVTLTVVKGATSSSWVTAVQQHYGDCLSKLKVTQPLAFIAGGSGTQQAGVVTTMAPDGTVLTWDVGTANTGDIITLPDDSTSTTLATVGC